MHPTDAQLCKLIPPNISRQTSPALPLQIIPLLSPDHSKLYQNSTPSWSMCCLNATLRTNNAFYELHKYTKCGFHREDRGTVFDQLRKSEINPADDYRSLWLSVGAKRLQRATFSGFDDFQRDVRQALFLLLRVHPVTTY